MTINLNDFDNWDDYDTCCDCQRKGENYYYNEENIWVDKCFDCTKVGRQNLMRRVNDAD